MYNRFSELYGLVDFPSSRFAHTKKPPGLRAPELNAPFLVLGIVDHAS